MAESLMSSCCAWPRGYRALDLNLDLCSLVESRSDHDLACVAGV